MQEALLKSLLSAIIIDAGLDAVKQAISEMEVGSNKDTISQSKQSKMEEFLLSFIGEENYEITKYDSYPNYDLYKKNGNIFMEHDKKNGVLWVSYKQIWSVFYNSFGLNYNEAQEFIKGMMEKTLEMGSVTPVKCI